MLATVLFPPLAVNSSSTTLSTYTNADTPGSKYSGSNWHLPRTLVANALLSVWTKQTIDLAGITRKQDTTLLPVNFVSTSSGYAKITGTPEGQFLCYDLRLITTEPLKEGPTDDSWLPPTSFPSNCGFQGGPMSPDRVIYGEMEVRATNANVTNDLLVPYERTAWGSGEMLACDSIFCYRIIQLISDRSEEASSWRVFLPPVNIQIPMMAADISSLSSVMQLQRNLGDSVAGERRGAL